MKNFSHIREAIFNEPWAIEDNAKKRIEFVIENAAENFAAGKLEMKPREKPRLQIMDGVAVIPIEGTIAKRMNMFSEVSGGTSIEQLDQQFTEAMASDSRAVLFHINSPGGSVMGVPEFASKVFNARSSGKTILALADGMTASAAVWIASQADEFYTTEASTVGSIGVIASVIDDTRLEKNAGIDRTIIRSSELKGAGNGPMTPSQFSSIQTRVNDLFGMFKDSISRARPGMNIETVATGDMWIGVKACEMGLCDGIATLDSLLAKYGKKN